MTLPKYLFPFAGKKKLSGTDVAMHLAVYGALIWIVLRASHKKDGFQSQGAPPMFIMSYNYMFANMGDTLNTNMYILLTWYNNDTVTGYVMGEYSGTQTGNIYQIYTIDTNTAKIATQPLLINRLALFKAEEPQYASYSTPIPTVGSYLTCAKYSVKFTTQTPVMLGSSGVLPIVGNTYTDIWMDTVTLSDGTKIPVILKSINQNPTNGSIVPVTKPKTTPPTTTAIAPAETPSINNTPSGNNPITNLPPTTPEQDARLKESMIANETAAAAGPVPVLTPGTTGTSGAAIINIPELSTTTKVLIGILMIGLIGFSMWMSYMNVQKQLILARGAASGSTAAAGVLGAQALGSTAVGIWGKR